MGIYNQDPEKMCKKEEEKSAATPEQVPMTDDDKNTAEATLPEEIVTEDVPAAEQEASVDAKEPAESECEAEEPTQELSEAEPDAAATTQTEAEPAEAAAMPEEGEKQDEPTAPNEMAQEPVVRYRWNYETQRATDEQRSARKRRSGIVTYAVVMTAFFAVSFAILIASLLTGGLVGRDAGADVDTQSPSQGASTVSDRIVYVREDDGESGVLTVQEIAGQSNPCVVAVTVKKTMGQGVGSGFVLTDDGYIATNYHVVENATSIQVKLYDGTLYDAELINFSEPDDLAVIKVDAKNLPVLPIGNSDDVLVGDNVVIIGHPAGLEYGWSTTNGIVSAINREVKIKNPDGTLNKKMTLLQTNANVNSGNSGGPMINEYGEVIGIISMKLANGYEGMGFAIPINGAMEIINAIVEKGHADDVHSSVSQGRPMLGVTGFDVIAGISVIKGEDGRYASAYGAVEDAEGTVYLIDRPGFFITETSPNGDAFGKLQEGDVIFAIDGTETPNRVAMMAIMDEKSIGDHVVIDFVRQGEVHSIKIKLTAEAPNS